MYIQMYSKFQYELNQLNHGCQQMLYVQYKAIDDAHTYRHMAHIHL